MEPYTSNIPSKPCSPTKVLHALPERPSGPIPWTQGDVSQSEHPQGRNQTAPSHVKVHSTSEAILNRENSFAASSITTNFPSDSDPRRRAVREIFDQLGLADPTPDVPSLSSPSSMPFSSAWTSPAMRSSAQHVSAQDAVFGHSRSHSRRGRGRNMPSGRLICRSWFTKGECDKPPGQCQYTHMHSGQGVSPLPSIEVHDRKNTQHKYLGSLD